MKRTFKCCQGKNREAVAVAADALWQLGRGRIKPAHCYVSRVDNHDNHGDFVFKGSQGFDGSDGSQQMAKCRACAIGGLMLSYLRRFDAGG